MCQQQITSVYKAMASASNMAAWWRQCIRSIVRDMIFFSPCVYLQHFPIFFCRRRKMLSWPTSVMNSLPKWEARVSEAWNPWHKLSSETEFSDNNKHFFCEHSTQEGPVQRRIFDGWRGDVVQKDIYEWDVYISVWIGWIAEEADIYVNSWICSELEICY